MHLMSLVLAVETPGRSWEQYGNHPHMWGWSWWWHFLWMIFLIGVIAIAVWSIVRTARRDGSTAGQKESIEIARRRYAKGEISREEFQQIKRDLES
jgi:putative membrane protein